MISRRNIYTNIQERPRTTNFTRTPIIQTASLTRTFGAGSNIYTALRRPTVEIPTRPTITIAPRPTAAVPIAASGRAVTRSLTRPAGGVTALIPTARAATPSRAGISTTGMATGGLGATFSGIESDIRGTASGIISTAKGFIPTATKIIVALVILKIVFWLLKSRRR